MDYQAPYSPLPRRRRRPAGRIAVLLAAVAIVGFAAGDAVGSFDPDPAPKPVSPVAHRRPPNHPSRAGTRPASGQPESGKSVRFKPRVIARFSGSGSEITSRFRVPGSGDWKLRWSYSCAAFGSIGDFLVNENPSDTSADVTVIRKGFGGHGSTYGYADTGWHYLIINTECAWRLVAISQP